MNVGKTAFGSDFRAQLPALAVGTHSVVIRACNAENECGPSSDALQFHILSPVPGKPGTPSLVPTQQAAINLPRAIQLAQCYAEWAIDRQFTTGELQLLASLHPQVPVTKDSVRSLLDSQLGQ